ncbi:MAG: hypothetical protein ACRDXX_19435 [Stackebrandtia sp.]
MNHVRHVVVAAVAALTFAVSPVAPAEAAAVSPTPVLGAGVNGDVYAMAYHDGSFYFGGDFTAARDDDAQVERLRLAAVSAETGRLRSFAPRLDGPVYAMTVDGDHLYLAGAFTQIDGLPAERVARLELDSGELDQGFAVSVDALPRALAVYDGRLYVGGNFNSVNGEPRGKIAAVRTDSGALDADFRPVFDSGVRDVHAAHGKLYVAGGFTTVDGAAHRRIAALDPATGAVESGFVPAARGMVYDVETSSDRLYAAVGGPGGHVQAFERDGSLAWERSSDGDVESVALHDGHVYAGGHFDQVCSVADTGPDERCRPEDLRPAGKMFALDVAGELLDWNPGADSARGVTSVETGSGAVAAGGTFATMGYGTLDQPRVAVFRQ